MSNISGISGGLAGIRNPTTFRYTITAPNTEESITLPVGTKVFTINNVGKRFVSLAYATGDILGNNFITLAPYQPHTSPGIITQNTVILFIQAPGLETLEVEVWR